MRMSRGGVMAAGGGTKARKPLWLLLAPAIFLVLWSAGFAVAKVGLLYTQPITLLTLRYAFVLAVLLPLIPIVRPPWPKRAADWLHLVAVGFLIQAVYFGLSYMGLGFGISAGAAALIVSLQPILVGLLAPRLAGERVGWLGWLGLALGLAGAAVVIVARSAIEVTSAGGILFTVGGLLGMTAATLYEKRFGINQHPVTSNVVQYAVGLVAVLPVAWAIEDMRVEWTGPFMASLAYLVICNSLIAITLLLAMVRHGEASRVSALFFLVPPGAALIAWATIGEAMPPVAWLGMALAAVGVALVGRPGPRARRS
jgi:drug/metabolite transporter (DMT)-like permease